MGQLGEQAVQTPVEVKQAAGDAVTDQFAEILFKLDELKKPGNENRKDWWDKFNVGSGLMIGALGALITLLFNLGQSDLQERQQASKYEGLIAAASTPSNGTATEDLRQTANRTGSDPRFELIRGLDVAVAPKEAVQIALRYAHPNRNQGDDSVANAATEVLKRLKFAGKSALAKASVSEDFQESEIALGVLSGRDTAPKQHVYLRVRGMDDFADVTINQMSKGALIKQVFPLSEEPKKLGHQFAFGEESAWLSIGDKLENGRDYEVRAHLSNGEGGCGMEFQLSARVQQIDESYRYMTCPNNKDNVLQFHLILKVDASGYVTVIPPEIVRDEGLREPF